jgi:hypothetical protein
VLPHGADWREKEGADQGLYDLCDGVADETIPELMDIGQLRPHIIENLRAAITQFG